MVRTCVGCRRTDDKGTFVRIVRAPEGDIRVDPSGKAPGRGAYVCPDPQCFDAAAKRGRLARALRGPVEGTLVVRLRQDFERVVSDLEGAV